MEENKEFTLETAEQERTSIRKKCLIMRIIAGVLIPVGIFLMILEDIMFIGIVLIIISIVLFIVSSSITSSFAKKFKENVITKLVVSELGPDTVYKINGGLNLGEINSLNAMLHPDRYFFEDYIYSVYNNVPYEMCDCKFQEEVVTRDSRGNRQVSYETYFFGRIIKIDFKRELEIFMKIANSAPVGFYNDGLEKIETEVIEFNKRFKCYVNDKEKAFYVLTPHLISKMLELEKMFNGGMTFIFKNGIFYVLINNSRSTLEVNVGKKIDDKQINRIKSEIIIGASIINEFRLDTDKFNKEFDI